MRSAGNIPSPFPISWPVEWCSECSLVEKGIQPGRLPIRFLSYSSGRGRQPHPEISTGVCRQIALLLAIADQSPHLDFVR